MSAYASLVAAELCYGCVAREGDPDPRPATVWRQEGTGWAYEIGNTWYERGKWYAMCDECCARWRAWDAKMNRVPPLRLTSTRPEGRHVGTGYVPPKRLCPCGCGRTERTCAECAYLRLLLAPGMPCTYHFRVQGAA